MRTCRLEVFVKVSSTDNNLHDLVERFVATSMYHMRALVDMSTMPDNIFGVRCDCDFMDDSASVDLIYQTIGGESRVVELMHVSVFFNSTCVDVGDNMDSVAIQVAKKFIKQVNEWLTIQNCC